MPRLLIGRCPLSPSYRCSLVVDGQRYTSIIHYYFCEKFNWRDSFPNADTKRYYELLRECDEEEPVVMLGRRLPRLRRKFKTLVNTRKPELGYVDNAMKLNVRCVPNWETAKRDAMLRALRARLSKPEIRQALHKTHGADLVYRPNLLTLRIAPSTTWGTPGANGYGRLLMSLRREIPCESDGIPVSITSAFPITIDWNNVEHDEQNVEQKRRAVTHNAKRR